MSLPTQAVSSPAPFPFLLPRCVAPSSYIQYCSSNLGAWRFQASQQRGLDSAGEIQRLSSVKARSVFSPPKSRLGSGLWMSLADGHIAACVMITLPSLSLSENQDMGRPGSQWDLLAP